MNLKNDNYVIYMGTKNFTEKYYKDKDGWLKISATGRKFSTGSSSTPLKLSIFPKIFIDYSNKVYYKKT